MRKEFLSIAFLGAALALAGCSDNQTADTTPTAATAKTEAKFGVPDSTTKIAADSAILQKNVMLILDMSGSMSESACMDRDQSKAQIVNKTLPKFLKSIPSDVAVGMIEFDGNGVRIIQDLDTTAAGRAKMIKFTSTVRPSGSTPLTEAFMVAADELDKQAKSQLGYGTFQIITVTDGEADDKRTLETEVNQILDKTPIQIATAGFCISEHHSLNNPGVTKYTDVGNEQTLQNTLQSALAEDQHFEDSSKF